MVGQVVNRDEEGQEEVDMIRAGNVCCLTILDNNLSPCFNVNIMNIIQRCRDRVA